MLKRTSQAREAHAHVLIVETARSLCLASYEAVMGSNDVRAEWKRRNPGKSEHGLQAAYINRYLRAHIAPARTTLTLMLTGPIDEKEKQRIHEALVLDNTLVRGRNAALLPTPPIAGATENATGSN